MIRSSAQSQEDGTVLLPHAFFRALFASGLLPEEAITRLSRQLGDDEEDEEDDDEDEDDEEDEEDDDDDDYNVFGGGRFRRGGLGRNGRLKGWDWFDIERQGKEAGKRLARGGEFGRVGFPMGEEARTEVDPTLGNSVTGGMRKGSRSGSKVDEVLMERDDDEGMDEEALATSPTSSIATHLSRSPTASTMNIPPRPGQTQVREKKPRRRTSSSSSVGPPRTRRRSSASSLASMALGIEDDGRVRGIKGEVKGRGGWVKGMKGFGREVGRGVWGSSGREEWSKVCPGLDVWESEMRRGKKLMRRGHGRNACLIRMGRSWLPTRLLLTSDNIRMVSDDSDRLSLWGWHADYISAARPLVLLHGDPRFQAPPLLDTGCAPIEARREDRTDPRETQTIDLFERV